MHGSAEEKRDERKGNDPSGHRAAPMEAENDRRPKKAGRNDQKAPTEKPLENVQAQPVDQPVILNEIADQRKETQRQTYDRTYLTAYRLFGSGFG